MSNNKIKFSFIGKYSFSIIRILIGLLFLYSSISKFLNIVCFRYSIMSLKMFSFELTMFITYAIPWIELILGLFLIFGLFTRFAAIHAGGLMIIFAFVTYYAMWMNISGDCNCPSFFVSMSHDIWHIVLLIFLFISNMLLAINRNYIWALDNIIRDRKK